MTLTSRAHWTKVVAHGDKISKHECDCARNHVLQHDREPDATRHGMQTRDMPATTGNDRTSH